jgi:hypothetical protein
MFKWYNMMLRWNKHLERMDYSLPQQLAYTLNMEPEIKLLNVLVEH